MSVVSCTLSRESPTASEDGRGRRTYKVVYEVEADDPLDGPAVIISGARATGPHEFPVRMANYAFFGETDASSFLQGVECQRRHNEKSRSFWTLTGTYSPLEPNTVPGDSEENPLLRPVKYRLEHVSYSRVVEKDKDDNPIVNAAGQEFDEPLEDEQSRMVLVAEKNVATLQEIINTNLSYSGKVNSDTYRGASPRMWYCHTIGSSDVQLEGGVAFYTATVRLELNFDTWDRKILNRGFKHKKSAVDESLIIAKDDDGLPVNEPVLLAADGTRLPEGQEGNFMTYKIKKEIAFSGLGV